jgi:hypothetical protein
VHLVIVRPRIDIAQNSIRKNTEEIGGVHAVEPPKGVTLPSVVDILSAAVAYRPIRARNTATSAVYVTDSVEMTSVIDVPYAR